MRIVRQNETEIVVEDSSVWISAICGLAAVGICAAAFFQSRYQLLLVAILFLVFALLWLRRTRFVFSGSLRSVQWTRLRMLRTQAGSIAFADVWDIFVDSSQGGNAKRLCRLCIRTSAATTPMSDAYGTTQAHAASLRTTLLEFVRTTAGAAPVVHANGDAARTQQLNESIRSLLAQGRKIDAILLIQQSDHLDLTEATFRVNQIANQMGMRTTAPKA